MKTLDNAIISIKPVYADAIMSGAKTVELRRRIPLLAPNTCLWIYATLPRGAVIGSALVSGVYRGAPEEIWQRFSNEVAIERCVFDAYFDGASEAIGLALSEIVARKPISIERLKEIRNNFHPPQVLMHLTEEETQALQEISEVIA